MQTHARILASTSDHLMATWQQVFILVWINNTTVPGVDALKAHLDQFGAAHPRGIGLLTIVDENAPVPPGDARAALADFLHGASKFVRYSAVVHEGSGFRAAAVRSVVTGLSLMARQQYPHKIFATVEDASRWLCPGLDEKVGVKIAAKDLIATVAGIRAPVATARVGT